MISINASYTNLVNQRTLATNTNALHKATERLATGMRVNHANDDAAALFVGSSLSSSLSGMKIALDNTMLASNFLNIADGALSNVSDNLMRMNQLATQACNGFMSTEARQTLQAELNQMKANITQTIGKADMNGVSTVKNTGMSADLMVEIDVQTEEQLKAAGYVECNETNLNVAENTKFYINSAEQLKALATYTNGGTGTTEGKTFTLSNDIDLSSVCSAKSGVSWEAIGTHVVDSEDLSSSFQGTFDGNGHVVSNLYINKTDGYYQGLFGHTHNGAVIRNIGVENVNITGCGRVGGILGASRTTTIENAYTTGTVSGKDRVGGLAGSCTRNSIIRNVYSKADIFSEDEFAGGLCAVISESSIINAYATGNVTNISGVGFGIGGLVGTNYDHSLIKNAFATGNITSTVRHAGGLTGLCNNSQISNCFVTGNINGTVGVGGLVGQLENAPNNISNSFSTGNVNGEASSSGLLIGYNFTANPGTTNYYSTNALLNGATGGNVFGSGSGAWTNAPVGASLADLKSTIDWSSWDTDIWDLSGDMPMFKARSTATSPAVENISFQISDGYDENSSIDYDCALTLNLINLDLSTVNSARSTLGKIQELLTTVNEKRSYIGTQLNRLSGIATSSQMTIENYSAARSTVMDTDIAQEVANMTRAQILQQISVSVLSQSKNIDGQIILSLIR